MLLIHLLGAAGALRGVMAQMQARGMGASSIAGQAMVQAALESALPWHGRCTDFCKV